MNKNNLLGKILYGSLFILVLPAFLVAWAYFTKSFIKLPVPDYPLLSLFIIVGGIFFIVLGMLNLWQLGNGLPMNAYPPKRFVTKGVYAVCKNPIYVGSTLLCFGLAAFFQSSSGFWLISPALLLMIVAYIIGFENEMTEKTFGKQDFKPFLSFPENSTKALSLKDRLSAFIIAYLPCFLINAAFLFTGIPHDANPTNTALDVKIPMIEFSVVFYLLPYPFILLLPFVLKTKAQLRNALLDILMATILSALIYFCLPLYVVQKGLNEDSFFSNLILFIRSIEGPNVCLPSIQVILTLIAARYFGLRFSTTKWLWYLLAFLTIISNLTTGNHTIAGVLAGIGVFIITKYRISIWNSIRNISETIANSWKEWHIGPVRIINHGFYAGASAFVGTLMISSFLGEKNAIGAIIVGISAVIGAALWAQIIEGSPRLQRPYGYYGSVVGAIIGSILLKPLLHISIMGLLASVSMAAPWIQLLGRLRCLVQGCCHGKPSEEWLGIKFVHPLSRVNKISHLRGVSVHPTQLYSIGANFISGLLLIRLYTLEMSATFIIGIYLLLNALSRFVEEYFRGEAQTPYWAGMRIYQWIAIFFMITGAIFTSLPSDIILSFQPTLKSFYLALGMGIFSIFAYGIDFPKSNKRFARLTSN